jgi:enamine deaminase RidA (YjgF/YER057c/UK114 family)
MRRHDTPEMAHCGYHPCNMIDTCHGRNLDNDLFPVVDAKSGTTLILLGQCLQDPDMAERIASVDTLAQTHEVMSNARQFIKECGGEMRHMTKQVAYLTDMRHREVVYRTTGEYINGLLPVCTGLVVVGMAQPEWLVDIDATAVVPD